jgi:hypothetical protein
MTTTSTGVFRFEIGVRSGHDTEEAEMSEREELLQELMDVIGEEGCGVSCEEATVYKDEEGWKMMLEGFMAPWNLGQTLAEAKTRIREYGSMGFGLSAHP